MLPRDFQLKFNNLFEKNYNNWSVSCHKNSQNWYHVHNIPEYFDYYYYISLQFLPFIFFIREFSNLFAKDMILQERGNECPLFISLLLSHVGMCGTVTNKVSNMMVNNGKKKFSFVVDRSPKWYMLWLLRDHLRILCVVQQNFCEWRIAICWAGCCDWAIPKTFIVYSSISVSLWWKFIYKKHLKKIQLYIFLLSCSYQ